MASGVVIRVDPHQILQRAMGKVVTVRLTRKDDLKKNHPFIEQGELRGFDSFGITLYQGGEDLLLVGFGGIEAIEIGSVKPVA